MHFIASENVRRFRAILETSLAPEKRKIIESLLAAEVAELDRLSRHDDAPSPKGRRPGG